MTETVTKVQGEPRMLIDGELVDAATGKTFENINPATEEVLGVCADGSTDEMKRAIAAARRAFDETSWSTDHTFRRRCLEQLQGALDKHREELRQMIVAEVGTPVLMTYAVQTDAPIDDLAFWAEMADSYEYERWLDNREVFGAMQRRVVLREAAGVVGAITPWNYPLYLNMAKLAPALAAGCTVVLKPAPDTPWSATVVGKLIAEETEIPPGVVNVVTSSDHLVGEVLTGDPMVDMVTFTGSTATGRRIMANAAPTVKKVFLELGGKSAHIVLDDANVPAVASSAGFICIHGGQGCAITTRMLLPRSRYEEGVEAAKVAFEGVTVGDPTDASVICGPLVSERQRQRVLGYIEKGREEGARVVTGGGVPADLPKGYFVEPTLFADVDNRSTIAQEEIFGPVLVLIPFDDDDDAVRIANESMYGLSGAVSSGSEERAMSVARRIRTGTVAVNGGVWFGCDVPFGGYRQSGLGRENGIEGFEEYLEVKSLALPADPGTAPSLG
jgi:aldehyde dehydrogenase (NAD+)